MVVTTDHTVVRSLEMELDDIANFGTECVRLEVSAHLCSDFEDFGTDQTGNASSHSKKTFSRRHDDWLFLDAMGMSSKLMMLKALMTMKKDYSTVEFGL